MFAASRWIDERGNQIDGDRMPLPVVLAPGQRALVKLPMTVPAAGRYDLVVSLVREGAYWLDGASRTVNVRTPAPNR